MRISRIHVNHVLASSLVIKVPDSTAHYLIHVLRLKETDTLNIFDGKGNEYNARIEKSQKNSVSLEVLEQIPTKKESPLHVTLLQAVAKGVRMDWVLQKATELSIFDIRPIQSKRTIVRLSEEKKDARLAHWRKIVISACEQCGRNRIPEIHRPVEFSTAIETLEETATTRLLLSPNAEPRLQDLEHSNGSVALLIGPEGGLNPQEVVQAMAHGFVSVRMGPRILRTETAPLVALSIIQSLWGDL